MMMARSSIWAGNGSCTRMPWKRPSAFRPITMLRSSSCPVSAGSVSVSLNMPASSQANRLLRTYTAEAASSPTNTATSPGVTPAAV